MSNTKITPRKPNLLHDNLSPSLSPSADAPLGAGHRVDSSHAGATTGLSSSADSHVAVSPQSDIVLSARRLCKSYKKGKHVIPVLRGVDFAARQGDFTAIVGQSGSGKSTLLHLLGTLDAPDAGEIHFGERRIDNLPTRERDALRNRDFGMIFQFYHLLPECSTLENVLMPMMIGQGVFHYWRKKREYTERAKHLIELVGLSHRLTHKPRELSGGEMQRTAIARALMSNPSLLLADEPTGNLDQKTGREILEILRTLNAQERLTIVMVTHDLSIAKEADHTVRLVEGLVEDA